MDLLFKFTLIYFLGLACGVWVMWMLNGINPRDDAADYDISLMPFSTLCEKLDPWQPMDGSRINPRDDE